MLDEDRTVDGTLKDTLVDPMELAVAKDGRVFLAERKGVIKMIKPGATEAVVMDELVRMGGTGGIIAVDHLGQVSLPFNCEGMYRASVDGQGRRTVAIYRDGEDTPLA